MLLTNRGEWIIFSYKCKGCDEEEYALPPEKRERLPRCEGRNRVDLRVFQIRNSGSGAERLPAGKSAEGSFRAGGLSIGKA